jgi:translation initiation factor 4A
MALNMTSENESETYDIINYDNFDDMNLNKDLLKGIYGLGFEFPSSIQQRAIVPLTSGKDIIAQSQSGTGKTGTFLIGTLQQIDQQIDATQVLILSHTRELAKQTATVANALSKYLDISINCIIGGNGRRNKFQFAEQTKNEKINSQIIIGTPGRIFDQLRRENIDVSHLKCFILDEADEMLSKGFQEQIQSIFKYIPQATQVGLFSATIPVEMLDITKHFMKSPLRILVKSEQLTLEGIKQFYVFIKKEEDKFDTLCDLYGTIAVTQAMIYCNSKKKVEMLKNKLLDNNFTVECIHGDMSQEERNEIMSKFRLGSSRILITTDILSRGIDVQQVSLVLNYDVPIEKETYIHRIGRSGRFGRKGVAINFVTGFDINKLDKIRKFYSTQIDELPINIGILLQ